MALVKKYEYEYNYLNYYKLEQDILQEISLNLLLFEYTRDVYFTLNNNFLLNLNNIILKVYYTSALNHH